jgi:hypothetical protein
MTRDEAEALILSFPEVEEAASYGRPAYKAFGKFFTRFRREDGAVVLGSVPHDERDMLIEIDPDTFFFTDHFRNYPYVLAHLAGLETEQLRGFLTRTWRKNAPKPWLKAWDAGSGR